MSPVLALQGGFYVITGLWPLIHMPSFVRVTGPKMDVWLVRTVGALAAAIGAALLSGVQAPPTSTAIVLGVGAALAFLLIDVVYVAGSRAGLPPRCGRGGGSADRVGDSGPPRILSYIATQRK